MKLGAENKRQLYIVCGVGAVALLCLYPLYEEIFGGPDTPPVVSAPVIKDATASRPGNVNATAAAGKTVSAPPGFAVGGKAAQKLGSGGGQLDPTLHMEAMRITESLVYTGVGRNIFAAGPSPTEIALAKPKAPARPIEVAVAPARPPEPTGPPPPPPIDLKFFGTATSANGTRRALLLHGDDVFLASSGDVVQRRYRVVEIAAKSITIEDIPNSNKQTLPLLN